VIKSVLAIIDFRQPSGMAASANRATEKLGAGELADEHCGIRCRGLLAQGAYHLRFSPRSD